jgi:hypothetical protein
LLTDSGSNSYRNRGVLVDSDGTFTQGVPEVRQWFFHDALASLTERCDQRDDVGEMVFLVRQISFRHPLSSWELGEFRGRTPHILHGDEKALAAGLPEKLKLIPQK